MARILIADDDKASLEFVRRALQQDGHQVAAVEDGSEALATLTGSPGQFDLLVTDISMPGLDGISLAQKLAAATPALDVLLMSGLTSELERAKGLGGRIRTLPKPFTLEQIRDEVRKILAG